MTNTPTAPMLAHTPGPWEWIGQNLEGPQNTDVITASVECGAWCQGGMARLTISDADRALIAAAPEQHELLATFTEWARQVAAREDVPRGIRSAAAGLAQDGRRLLASATTPLSK